MRSEDRYSYNLSKDIYSLKLLVCYLPSKYKYEFFIFLRNFQIE